MQKGSCGREFLGGGQGVQREFAVGGGGFHEHFWEQGQPVCAQKCVEGFHRRCIDYRGRQFVPKWNSTSAECVMATAGLVSLLVQFIGVNAWHWMGENRLRGEFQKTMGDLEP